MTNIFDKYDLLDVDESFPIPTLPPRGLILICGSSGSGKSTILRKSFDIQEITFDNRPIYQNFSSDIVAERLLLACGLRTIPAWKRPFYLLSVGEQHRAYCAKCLDINAEYIDEFTSVVDRNTAKSLSFSMQKHFRSSGLPRLVLATCHRDVIKFLNPDYLYDSDKQEWVETSLPRGCLWRPNIQMEISPCSVEDWVYFKKHHYLSGSISKSCHCYIGMIGGDPVAFSAILHSCSRDIHSYWRESRLVVKPEFQGIGIGKIMSEFVAELYVSQGKRFFSKTAHSALGEYRNNSPLWRATSTNGKCRGSYLTKDGVPRVQSGFGKTGKQILRDYNRVCYSHEYIGKMTHHTTTLFL